jgi:hypothetical protein
MGSDQAALVSIAGGISFAIPHMVVRARPQARGKRSLYPLAGDLVRVEHYAAHLLEEAGFRVFKGDDAHLFFSILSCNFKDSFFREVYGNWAGPGAEERVAQLDAAVSRVLARDVFEAALIDEAEAMLSAYYASYPPKRNVHTAIASYTRTFDHDMLLRLVRFYRGAGYTTKGAPDLFTVAGSSFLFVEVKSHTDSLSAAQYEFFQGYLTSVGDNILVMRVVPEDGGQQTGREAADR